MTMTVHHLQYSQSFRLIWLMEALGADYDLKIYARDSETNLAPAEYKALSPLGTAPVLVDGDTVVAESNASIDYVLDRHPESPLRPGPGDPTRERYLFWYHSAQGSMMPMLFVNTIFGMVQKNAPFFLRPLLRSVAANVGERLIKPRMTAILKVAEEHLAEHKWLAGEELTAADITMSYAMAGARKAGLVTEAHPGCLRWLKQMEADPAFQRAKAKDDGRDMLFSF
ncbi:glutathione S-transferase family protein [Alterisphingorhabdus coralli]|uniref:Glutathione S-transferase n=1 Tax=Alterisphingorhabdus coralli TaxID=3071408 RepID=A0AA97FB54_9SPHN|nr:glutathione S-transferase [Parasphingorhabdus sp. SCSIO 66989]WOE76392.1 glutathione S-transferase [Parasphingorhabdus sp. SCSIO 66989]